MNRRSGRSGHFSLALTTSAIRLDHMTGRTSISGTVNVAAPRLARRRTFWIVIRAGYMCGSELGLLLTRDPAGINPDLNIFSVKIFVSYLLRSGKINTLLIKKLKIINMLFFTVK